jgi:hypothetical protein
MPDPKTKTELVEVMISAREQLETILDLISPSVMALPGIADEWSVKDIIAHLNSYDRWLGLTLALRGKKPPEIWMEDIPLDDFNQLLFEENRDLSLDEVLQQSHDIWEQILRKTISLPGAYFFTERSVQDVPYRFRPCDILKSDSYGHYLDHLPMLRAWLDVTN